MNKIIILAVVALCSCKEPQTHKYAITHCLTQRIDTVTITCHGSPYIDNYKQAVPSISTFWDPDLYLNYCEIKRID